MAIDHTRIPPPASMTDGFTNFSSQSGPHRDILSPAGISSHGNQLPHPSHLRHSSVGPVAASYQANTGGLPSVPESRGSRAALNQTLPL